MADATDILDAFHGIASRMDHDMSEKDVENAFLNEDFYSLLGYEGAGRDLRSEFTLPDNRRPDYLTLDDKEAVTAVYEFKTTGRELSPHTDQLFHYMTELKADYGVLTNGERFLMFRRGETRTPMLDVDLENATDSDARNICSALQKPIWDVTNPDSVEAFLRGLDPVELTGELGQEHFFDTFRLEPGSPFAELVTAMSDLLGELRDEKDAKFVTGAYDFWEATYASEPDEVPDIWDSFVDEKQSLRDFMFCLESGHALLGRVLLAKAAEDHDFFPTDRRLERYFDELGGFSGNISLDAYPVAANGMIEDMREQLVESLFEDDIFIWWTDGFTELTATGHDSQISRFQEVAEGSTEVTRVSTATRERFSRALANVFFAVLKFDFTRIEGDLLGDLYQRYFDPETRKALGEFYTPQPVVEYIMDGVDYDVGVSSEKLIDPACGSGTFLVEAIDRYLEDVRRYHDDPDWAEHLTELCTRPHIVGLDIHPFAVLMAQIRFMVAILPEYRDAKSENEGFTLRRLPIFRTDTLRNERELTGADLGEDGTRQLTWDAMTEDNQDVRIPVPLPVEVDVDAERPEIETEDGFLVKRIRMPLFDTIQLETGVSNFGEYFAALQGVLDVVKYHMAEEVWEYKGGLEEGIDRYTTREYDALEDFFAPYVDDMLSVTEDLKENHGDGRLFKIFEDTVLALVAKNYMSYDYVVGNPPYVNIKHIPDRDHDRYKRLYDSAFGRFDLYVLFIERGLEMMSEKGRFGFITPNKFTRSSYGKEIRKIIAEEYSLVSYVEFGDVDVFDDATNFACILLIDRDLTRSEVPYAKIHKGSEGILEDIRQLLGEEEMITDELELSNQPSNELSDAGWRFLPAPVRDIGEKIRKKSYKDVGEISLGVRQGVSSGGDEAFIVSTEDIERFDLEEELLYPIVRGKQVRRWAVSWEGDYAIYPYSEDGDLVEIEEYPNTKDYLDDNEDYLRERYCVKKGNKGIYEYDGPRPKSMFEGDFRIPTPDMSTTNNFTYSGDLRCFKNTVYVVTFSDDQPYSEIELLGLLNSSVAEFIIKQISPPLRGNPFRYRYKTQYVDQVPLPEPSTGVESLTQKVIAIDDLSEKVRSFPNEYVTEYSGEVDYINYTWQTKRTPVDADIQQLADGRYAVTAGRSDEIATPLIDQGGDEERKLRARYVQAAVDGRNVKRGKETTIPIPASADGVRQLLDDLEADRQTVAETDIEELEAEIDEAVYDLFELTEGEREVIEEYLEIF